MIRLRSTHSTANDEDEEESTTTSISLINQSKYCLYLLNDNETTSTTTSSGKIDFLDDIQLHVCLGVGDAGEEQTGDIEKQLQKGLVRVIGETNLIKSKAFKKKKCVALVTQRKKLIVGTSISLPLLIITLIVLWYLGQYHTIHGKCLICHIVSLILLYTFLILDRMDTLIQKIPWLCEISGYMMYTSILFCIFWLNVMRSCLL